MKKFAVISLVTLLPLAAFAQDAPPPVVPPAPATGFFPLLGVGGLAAGAVGVGVLGAIANGGGGQPADTTN